MEAKRRCLFLSRQGIEDFVSLISGVEFGRLFRKRGSADGVKNPASKFRPPLPACVCARGVGGVTNLNLDSEV